MDIVTRFLKSHLWAVFLLHQSLIFLSAFIFLTVVSKISGRRIHLGEDPVGWIDGTVLIALSISVIIFSRALYSWFKREGAPSLGLAFSPRRLMDLLGGILIGFVINIFPYAFALMSRTAVVTDRITAHFSELTVIRILAVAFFLLLLQGLTEEVANRAFPIRLWSHRSIMFRILVPSIFFALIHFAGESFTFGRAGLLLLGGITQCFAYLLTGNVWLVSGTHAGANFASFAVSGLWHAGAIINIVGYLTVPNWTPAVVSFGLFGAAFIYFHKYKTELT
jgi:hypothetical protein